jgi:hypothetical protein
MWLGIGTGLVLADTDLSVSESSLGIRVKRKRCIRVGQRSLIG